MHTYHGVLTGTLMKDLGLVAGFLLLDGVALVL